MIYIYSNEYNETNKIFYKKYGGYWLLEQKNVITIYITIQHIGLLIEADRGQTIFNYNSLM